MHGAARRVRHGPARGRRATPLSAAEAPVVVAHARVVDGGRAEDDGWVRFEDGVVAARGRGAPPEGVEVVDAGGDLLVPGLIDLHVHGGGGADVEGGPVALPAITGVHRAHGTTRTALSLVSAPVDVLVDRLAALAPAVRADPGLLGLHLEGPFLSSEARGAHDPAALTAPTAAAVDALLEAADGTLLQVTLAPELPGGLEALRRFVDAGVRVAVGHTTAELATAAAAFDAGATLLTHAFNAMPPLGHRAPGPLGAALSRPHVVLELIADGVHVHPVVVAALFAMAPGRVALITDAMSATGMGDGDYRLGTLDVRVEGGAARLTSGSLAGSTLTLDAAIRTAVDAGVALEDAVAAATAVPARAAGRPDLGALTPGAAADAVLLTPSLEVRTIWQAGHRA